MEDDAECLNKVTARDCQTQESNTRAREEKGKELQSPLEELIKSMKDLQLTFAELEKVEACVNKNPRTDRKLYLPMHMVRHHSTKKEGLQESSRSSGWKFNFYQDGNFHLSETQQPLQFNFGKGVTTKLMEDTKATRILTTRQHLG